MMRERFGGFRMWNYVDQRCKDREKDAHELAERHKFMERADELRK